MNVLKKYTIMLSLAVTLTLLLSACITPNSSKSSVSLISSGSPKLSPSPSLSAKSPADILRESIIVMKQLKSTHTVLSLSETTVSSTSEAGVSSSTPGKPVTTNADGDVVFPDQTQISFTSLSMTNTSNISQVVKGEQVYMQTLKGKWYSFSGEAANYLSFERPAVTKYPFALATLLPLAQGTNFLDHGTEIRNGKSLRHITVPVANNAFNALWGLNMVDSVLDGKTHQQLVKLENGALDVWIDETTSYVDHMTLITNTSYDMSSLQSKSPTSPPASIIRKTAKNLTVDFSQFNQMTSIPTPANATPYMTSASPALSGLCPVQLKTVLQAD